VDQDQDNASLRRRIQALETEKDYLLNAIDQKDRQIQSLQEVNSDLSDIVFSKLHRRVGVNYCFACGCGLTPVNTTRYRDHTFCFYCLDARRRRELDEIIDTER
jgi:hypothetical protein